jgi:hypothetical protein
MAYCRLGKDSDVQVIEMFNKFHKNRRQYGIYLFKLGENDDLFKEIICDTVKECIAKLLSLREQGYKIPQIGIERLTKQMEKEKAEKKKLKRK